MKLFDWRDKNWRERVMLILTIFVVVVLASHPELRLFLPLVDALGLDLLLALMTAQFLDYIRPLLYMLYRNVILPLAGKLHSLLLFFSGDAGHYLTMRFASYYYSRKVASWPFNHVKSFRGSLNSCAWPQPYESFQAQYKAQRHAQARA